MCQPVINPAGRVRELSPSSPVVPSGAPQFGSWLPSPLPSRELAPGYRGAGRNIWVSWSPWSTAFACLRLTLGSTAATVPIVQYGVSCDRF